jgi:hypothetical protein
MEGVSWLGLKFNAPYMPYRGSSIWTQICLHYLYSLKHKSYYVIFCIAAPALGATCRVLHARIQSLYRER